MTRVELFSFAACPYAQRARMVLIEKGIEHEVVEVDLYDRPAWFREVSPYGKVPVLRHDGRVVYESAVINQYLDESFPVPALMPPDPWGRAQARIWMDYCDTRYIAATHRLMADRDDPAKLATARDKLAEVMRFMEHEGLRRSGDGPFWLGPEPTLVDFQFLPFFERFAVYEELAGAQWPDDCTRLKAWFRACAARPAYLQTRHTLDFHLEQQRRLMALRPAATRAAAPGN